jgi:hypothetical protein
MSEEAKTLDTLGKNFKSTILHMLTELKETNKTRYEQHEMSTATEMIKKGSTGILEQKGKMT